MTKTPGTIAGFLALTSIASTAATLAVVSSFQKRSKNQVINRYQDFNDSFKKYSNSLLPDSPENNVIRKQLQSLEHILFAPSTSYLEKWKTLNQIGNIQKDVIFNWANALIANDGLSISEVKKLKELLEPQAKRLQEKDLASQFSHNKISDLKLALGNFLDIPKQKQQEFIKSYKEFFEQKIAAQYKLVEKYLMQANNSLDDNIKQAWELMPTKALRNSFDSNAHQIELMLFEPSFRINDIARTKEFIEGVINDAKSVDNSQILAKFKAVSHEMNEIVNADVQNVVNTIANELLNNISADSIYVNDLKEFKKSIDLEQPVSYNRNVFDNLIKFTLDNQIVANQEFDRILAKHEIQVYNKLSEYYLTISAYKLDVSQTVEDFDNVLANLKTFKKMLQDRTKTNADIINEFKSFVDSQKEFNFAQNIFNKIKNNKDFNAIVNANEPDKLNKSTLIANIIKFRNEINTLKTADKNAQNLINEAQKAHKVTKLISLPEEKQFEDQIHEIFNDSKDVSQLVEKLKGKQNALESIIGARIELKDTINELEHEILELNDYNKQILERYLSKNAQQLATDLLNEVSIFSSKDKFEIKNIVENKHLFNEKLRVIEKQVLEHLEKTTNSELEKLNIAHNIEFLSLPQNVRDELQNKYINIEALSKIVNDLNKETNSITSIKFNPITSKELIEQIKKYKFVVNVLSAAQKHNESILSLAKSKQYAETAFNPTNEQPPKYSENARSHLNKITQSQNELTNNAQNINNLLNLALNPSSISDADKEKIANSQSLNSDESLNIFNKANELVKGNQKITQAIASADSSINNLDKLLKDVANEYGNLKNFELETAEFEKIKQAIKDELAGNADPEKIAQLTQNANDILKTVAEKRKEGSLNLKIKNIEQKLDELFKNSGENKTNGEIQLRSRLDKLKKEAQNPKLTKDRKLILTDQAAGLDSLIEKVIEVDQKIASFKDKSAELSKDPDIRKRVPDSISETTKTLDSLTALVNDIAISEELPTAAELHNKLKELEQRDQHLEISFNKDKLEAISDRLTPKKFSINDDAADGTKAKFNKAIENIQEFVNKKLDSESLNDLVEAKNLVLKENELIDALTKAINEKEQIEKDSSLDKKVSGENVAALDKVIAENMPNLTVDPIDTTELIASKIAKVNKAVAEAKEKHELSKIIENELKKVLSDNETTNKALESVKNELDAAIQKNESIVKAAPGTYSAEQIQAAQEELKQTIEKLKEKKQKLINEYNEVKNQTDEILADLETKVATAKQQNAEDKFDNFEKAKQEYQNELKDAANSTIESLKAKQQALKDAYHKDLASNAAAKYKKYVENEITSQESTNSNYKPIKDLANEFKSQIEERLKTPFDSKETREFIELTQSMKNYNDLQKDIADFIKKLKDAHQNTPNDVEAQKAVQEATKLFEQQYMPIKPFNKADIDNKRKTLLEEFRKVEAKEAKRTENKILANELFDGFDNFRAQPELMDGQNKARVDADKALEETLGKKVALGDSIDPQLTKVIKDNLDAVKEKNKTAATIEEATKIGEKLEAINKIKPYINALALEVGSALKIINNNKSDQDPLIRSFIDKELEGLVVKARELYIKADDGENVDAIASKTKEEIKQQIARIEKAKENVQKAKDIKQTLVEAKQINADINYHSVSGVSGEANKDKVDKWLDSIASSAIFGVDNATNTEQSLDNAKKRIDAAKKLVEKLKEVSNEVTKWKSERNLNSTLLALTEKDEELLTNAMWTFVPTTNDASDAQAILQKVSDLEAKFKGIAQIRNKRVETLNKIDGINKTPEYKSLEQNPTLLNIVNSRIRNLQRNVEQATEIAKINEVGSEVDSLISLLPKEIELAEKIKQAKEYANQLTPLNENITTKKNEFVAEIAQANNQLSKPTPKSSELETRKSDIDKEIAKLDLHKARLDVLKQWTELKQQIDNNATIQLKEKEALNAKMESFANELNSVEINDQTTAQQFNTIADKWLKGESENSIPYLLNLAQTLQNELNKAKTVRLTSSPADGKIVTSDEISKAYELLAKDISEAEALIQNASNATIQKRKELIQNFETHGTQIINAKKQAMNDLKIKANELYGLIPTDSQTNYSDFKKASIDALNEHVLPILEHKKEIIENIDKLIVAARDKHLETIKKVHEKQSDKLDKILNELNDFALNIVKANIWTTKSIQDFEAINSVIKEIEEFKKSHTYFEDDFSKFADVIRDENYSNKYLTPAQALEAKATKARNTFIASISNDIKSVLDTNSGTVTATLKAIKDVVEKQASGSSNSNNLFDKLQFSELKGIFEALQTSNTETNKILESLEQNESKKSVKVSENINKVYKHIVDFDSFIIKLKDNINTLLEERKDISEILNNVLANPNGNDKNGIAAKYQEKYNSAKSLYDRLQKSKPNGFVAERFMNSDKAHTTELLTNIDTFFDYVNQEEFNKFFKDFAGTVPPKPHDKYTLEDFKKEIDEIAKTANGEDKIDVTNNVKLLPLFEQFGNTQIDLANKFNPVYVRVYIVKDSTSSFYSLSSSNESQKTIKLKLRYEYKPNNLLKFTNYQGFTKEIDRDIAFSTDKMIGLPKKSRDIFYKNYDAGQFGVNSKQVIANTDRLGWSVSSKEEAVKKLFEKIKKAAGFDGAQEVILDTVNNKLYRVNNNNITEHELTNKINLKFILPESFIYQQSTQVKGDTSKQFIRLRFENNNRLVVEVASPAQLVVGALNYNTNGDTIELVNGAPKPEYTMPSALLTTLKFEFNWDQSKKDIEMHIAKYETYHVTKHKKLTDSSVNAVITYESPQGNGGNKFTATVWTADDFAKWLIKNNSDWKSPEGNKDESPLKYSVTTNSARSNSHTGKAVDEKFIIKNARYMEAYIWQGDNNNQMSKNGAELMYLYTSGIEAFEFEDIKE
ncbi:hypothetical protein MBVG596_0760 [Mycoplasmopsis bovigenitalium]|uniref:hypothetical protein n=1 Tax=Mycoplasmopsis bovigenitalium TaxID=2112 RepID=UPI00090BE7C4|nr:hypothetical protein [Mycoplasmopsis bovigenitalium]BAW18385.1 hypothetical protein MBVG596_0760 [Mycoplasmopsis bovigenitalium]